jgi:hypothetical protein
MKSIHAKSPCCGAQVRRFGPRRRQCVNCRRTWTVRPRKRGRPRHRMELAVLRRVLVEGLTLGQLYSQHTRVALPAYRYRFRQALKRWVSRARPQSAVRGPLVLLADGLWFEFDGVPWVLYLIALKPCGTSVATFLDPVLLPGKEGAGRWQQAFGGIPETVRRRVKAMVVDNLRGMRKIAAHQQWLLQLCHFHLLLKLQAQRGRIRYRLHGGAVREEIHQLIRKTLELPDGRKLNAVIRRLRHLSKGDCGTDRVQAMVREFLDSIPYYRTYLAHPDLALPHTTNSVESMCRLLREMFRSSRAGSNPRSVLLWATALLRLRPTVVCNGHPINRKS